MLEAVLTLAGLGLLASLGLGLAARRFAVKEDPVIEELISILPGVNCGSCGNPSCTEYAKALVEGKAEINDCPVGDADLKRKIADKLGLDYAAMERRAGIVFCQGALSRATKRFVYQGVPSCRACQLVVGGDKECPYGCLGFGDCLRACPFGAVEIKDGVSTVNEELCTACGNCVRACPFGAVFWDARQHKPQICVYCGYCASYCPYDVLALEEVPDATG